MIVMLVSSVILFMFVVKGIVFFDFGVSCCECYKGILGVSILILCIWFV